MEFTLRDVGPRDAGPYICMRGLTAADVVEDCGQTLVVVGEWRDYYALLILFLFLFCFVCLYVCSVQPRFHENA